MKDKLRNSRRQIINAHKAEKIVFTVIYFALLSLVSCEQRKEKSHEGHNHSKEETYYCPMDTDVVQKEPGVCPKCKMNLVKKENTSKAIYYCPMDSGQEQKKPGVCKICNMDLVVKPNASQVSMYDLIVNPSNVSILSSVTAIKPVLKSMPVTIKAFGYVSYDTRRIYTISSRVNEGRVEKLYVKFPFQPIKEGQPLLELFSHELLSAQKEYFFLKETDPEASDLISAAKQKLVLLGMTESQISNLKHDGHILHPTTTIYSPYTGYVIEDSRKSGSTSSMSTGKGKMDASPEMGSAPMSSNNFISGNQESLILREGAYLNRGATIFKVVNTDIVWGIFEVYSDQLPLIKINQNVTIKIESSDKMITGKVDFIEPDYEEGAKTSRFRVYLQNKDQKLKIGNLLQGEIKRVPERGLWIPQSALYDLGIDKIIFIKKGGAFEARKVTIGIVSDSLVEVISGLNENEEIAGNADYLVDSESFIKVRSE